jgi:SH3 domain protein
MRRSLPLLLLLGLCAAAQAANVMYVDDKLLVGLRAEANSGRTITTLETGTRLEVLETSGSYIKVRDPKGNEGWVRDQYLTAQPVARDRLTQAEQRIAALEADKEKLRSQVSGVASERTEAVKGRSQLEKENQKLQQELAAIRESAANPLKLSNENRMMRDRLATLEAENQRMLTESQNFQDDNKRQWFLTGAGVLTGGILIGLIAPRLRRRRSSWSSDF